jgi:DNA gyrase subunit A
MVDKIISANIVDEVHHAYLEYAMSVIVGRALPDVRDGFKPVHRRILFAMYDLNNRFNQPYKKSARIVGDVIGKYHPHGDTAVYDTMVRMAQDFSMRYPLVQGQGNFGSVDGDAPAAMRYTEVRMAKLSEFVLNNIEKETVMFAPNYDGTLKEPTLLPVDFPNLLVNGSSGIAVGMATNIPPHNLSEVIDGLVLLIDKPGASIEEIIKKIPGPDFPTAGVVYGINGLHEAYKTGKGVIQVRAKAEVEELKGHKSAVVIHEIPYQVNKAALITKIADLVRDKVLEGISDIRDESSREGLRVVIELKKGESPDLVLNKLYKHSQLQVSFGIQMLALDGNVPKLFSLKEVLHSFIDFRKEVITRRSLYDLRKLKEKIHILEGLVVAVSHIDEVVSLIKKSKNTSEAQAALVKTFELSEIQAKSILDMRLHRLTQLETHNLKEELATCVKEAEYLQKLLADEKLIFGVMKQEFIKIREEFGDKRRTQIERQTKEFIEEDLIDDEDMVVTISHRGYIKRHPLSEYRSQRRGGRGVRGVGIQNEDFIEDMFIAGNHSVLLCFSDFGKIYWQKVYKIPEGSKVSRGRPVVNMLNIQTHEKIVRILPVEEFVETQNVMMVTRKGVVKKTSLTDFSNIRSSGIIALKCDEGDTLVDAKLVTDKEDAILVSEHGTSIRFGSDQVRTMGRNTRGVIGMRLDPIDKIVALAIPEEGTSLLTISSNGYGKRTEVQEFRKQNRGGSGVIAMKTTPKTGSVIGCLQVGDEDEIMLVSNLGQMIRIKVSEIREAGRNTQGVKLIGLKEEENVVSFALCDETESDNLDGST